MDELSHDHRQLSAKTKIGVRNERYTSTEAELN